MQDNEAVNCTCEDIHKGDLVVVDASTMRVIQKIKPPKLFNWNFDKIIDKYFDLTAYANNFDVVYP